MLKKIIRENKNFMKQLKRQLLNIDKKHGAQNYKPLPVILNRGQGEYLYDINDKQYYDFLSSYSSINQGHCHPKLVEKMKKECENLTLCSRAFHNENLIKMYEYMHNKFNYDKCLPMNTGVEACETSIKLARLWGYKKKGIPKNEAVIVVANNNFWGRSIAACSSSSEKSCYDNFGPFVPGFDFVDYNNIIQLETMLKNNKNIAAVMLEPIQGEAGIVIPGGDYLLRVKTLCKAYNVLLICDEVQTGIGRTGRMLASELITPDMVVLGKALSGGMMPVSCVLGNNEVMDLLDPGTHGSTYGGNPLAAALVPEAITIIKSEGLMKNANIQGNIFRREMQEYVKSGVLKDVRGVGLLNAIEFEDEKKAEEVVNNFMKNGLLTKVTRDGTIRMCPPLTIKKKQMEECLEIIKKSI